VKPILFNACIDINQELPSTDFHSLASALMLEAICIVFQHADVFLAVAYAFFFVFYAGSKTIFSIAGTAPGPRPRPCPRRAPAAAGTASVHVPPADARFFKKIHHVSLGIVIDHSAVLI
jgi:hypothetical protein